MAEWTKATVLKTVVPRTPVNEWLDPMKEAPLSRGGFSCFSATPTREATGGGYGEGGGVVSGRIPSYNYGVMTETILHHTSSLDGLLERLSPELHLRREEFEHAAK